MSVMSLSIVSFDTHIEASRYARKYSAYIASSETLVLLKCMPIFNDEIGIVSLLSFKHSVGAYKNKLVSKKIHKFLKGDYRQRN